MPDAPGYQPIDVSNFQPGEHAMSGLSVLTLPNYILSWLPATTAFSLGDAPSLAWIITEASGATVPDPSSATINIARPDGGTDSVPMLYASSNTPAVAQRVGSIYQFEMKGVYSVQLQVVLNDGVTPAQTRSAVTLITIS